MKKTAYLLTLLLAVGALAGCTGGRPGQGAEEEVMAKEETAIAVETESLKSEAIDIEVYTFGYLQPEATYVVTPYGAGGIVDEIMVSAGDYVEAGDVLYTLETDDLELSKDQTFLQNQTSVTSARNSLESLELSLAQSQSSFESAKLSLDDAKTNLDNTEKLYASAAVSKAEYDAAKNGYEQALNAYNQAQLSIQSTQVSYNSALSSYNSAVDTYELSRQDFADRDSDLIITAPISGLVTEVSIQEDEMTSGVAGVTVTNTSEMTLDVKVMENYIHSIEKGQNVRLTTGDGNMTLNGSVTDISLTAQNGYYPVEITISNDNKELTAGSYAEGYIQVDAKSGALMVDKTSLLYSLEGEAYLFTVNEATMRAEAVYVTTGLAEDTRIEVIGDISAGDTIVNVGQDYLTDGQLVLLANQ